VPSSSVFKVEISRFVRDSSRSYANWFVVYFLVGVFLTDADDSTTDATLVQAWFCHAGDDYICLCRWLVVGEVVIELKKKSVSSPAVRPRSPEP
jgi:hypothetical protein